MLVTGVDCNETVALVCIAGAALGHAVSHVVRKAMARPKL